MTEENTSEHLSHDLADKRACSAWTLLHDVVMDQSEEDPSFADF